MSKHPRLGILRWLTVCLTKLRIFFLYHFRLLPRIRLLRKQIDYFIQEKRSCFEMGKSLLEFPGEDNIIYFVIFKDERSIKVLEIYDSWVRKIPEQYTLLRKYYLENMM